MKKIRLALLLPVIVAGFGVAITLASAEESANDTPDATADYTILQINDDPIKKSHVAEIWQGLFPEGAAPDFDGFDENVRQNVLRGIVSEHLIYQEAEASGLADSEEIKEKLENLKKKLVMRTFLDKKAESKVTDEGLKAAYDERTKALAGKQEVHARHILVDDEELAKKLAKELEDGKDFAELAKASSKDKASAVSGGDLGFFTEDRMVPEFSEAAFALDVGNISEPVKSPFGWHIIKVEEKRDVTLPAFEEVKDQLREEVKGKALRGYIGDLIDSAEVKYFDAEGTELELTRTPDTTGEEE